MNTGALPAIKQILRALTLSVLALPFLYSGDDQPTALEQVQQRGSLTLLTRNGASSYYLGVDGPTGPEYELVREFCRYLDVVLEVEVADAFNQLTTLLDAGQGELIAANLTRTPAREQQFNFGPDYIETKILAVYRRGSPRPENVGDLVGRKVMILAGSSYEEALVAALPDHPRLRWELRDDVGIEDLLLAVADKAIDVTLVDSNIFAINQLFYPNVEAAFTMQESVPHAWAFRGGADDTLADQARAFMLQAESEGQVAALLEGYHEQRESLERPGMFQFLNATREKLPALIEVFREAGDIHGIDWRLLAAVGYQESHWDPEASSYTGVRGIMMLTEQTAEQLGVTDRLDPVQSIEGGARYISRLRSRLPTRIDDPDRTWMALAAYNLGMSHLRDARILTQKRGFDPDRWTDVSASIALLTHEKWFSQTKHGYARGYEAKAFVENIRRYHEILVWMETREHPLLVAQADGEIRRPNAPVPTKGNSPIPSQSPSGAPGAKPIPAHRPAKL